MMSKFWGVLESASRVKNSSRVGYCAIKKEEELIMAAFWPQSDQYVFSFFRFVLSLPQSDLVELEKLVNVKYEFVLKNNTDKCSAFNIFVINRLAGRDREGGVTILDRTNTTTARLA